MPSKPDSAAARATEASHPAGSSSHRNREICSTKPSSAGCRRCSPAARPAPGLCAGSIVAGPAPASAPRPAPAPLPASAPVPAPAPTAGPAPAPASASAPAPPSVSARSTMSQPSAVTSLVTARIRRNCASSAAAGTGWSRARLRWRHTAGLAVSSTATVGRPARRASSSWPRRRAASWPSVSTTVVSPRPSRAATIWSSSAKASADASRSCSPLPTTLRSTSAETTSWGRYRRAAQVDLPDPAGPISTTRAGSGMAAVTAISLAPGPGRLDAGGGRPDPGLGRAGRRAAAGPAPRSSRAVRAGGRMASRRC
jgi:hypothetical protein